MIFRHAFLPPDNRRLAHLSGSLDSHLRTIEAAFDVSIQRRSESFRIEGAKADAERALALLKALYGHAERPISDQELELGLLQAMATSRAPTARAAANERDAAKRDAAKGKNAKGDAAKRDAAKGDAAKGEAAKGEAAKGEAAKGEAAKGSAAKGEAPNGAASDAKVDPVVLQTRRAGLVGRTPNQLAYLRHILDHDITFGIGPAGTGKTYLAVACAVDALERNSVQRIILTRPAVEAGERLGFLPGDLSQKVDPYLRPLYDALYELMGMERVAKAFEKGTIEVAPLAFMRGRTLNHAFVILDEAQNTTPEQMKMFLTRIGFGARAVVTGDVSQIDLPRGSVSGLVEAEQVLRRVRGIAITHFTAADVVRHPLVAHIVEAYAAAAKARD